MREKKDQLRARNAERSISRARISSSTVLSSSRGRRPASLLPFRYLLTTIAFRAWRSLWLSRRSRRFHRLEPRRRAMDPKDAALPPPNTQRWVVRRKAAVVAAVRAGVITLEEACRRYQLSEEEFLAWQRAFEAHGLPGLRTTRIQSYRDLRSGDP